MLLGTQLSSFQLSIGLNSGFLFCQWNILVPPQTIGAIFRITIVSNCHGIDFFTPGYLCFFSPWILHSQHTCNLATLQAAPVVPFMPSTRVFASRRWVFVINNLTDGDITTVWNKQPTSKLPTFQWSTISITSWANGGDAMQGTSLRIRRRKSPDSDPDKVNPPKICF